jgi:hypothetical protein
MKFVLDLLANTWVFYDELSNCRNDRLLIYGKAFRRAAELIEREIQYRRRCGTFDREEYRG